MEHDTDQLAAEEVAEMRRQLMAQAAAELTAPAPQPSRTSTVTTAPRKTYRAMANGGAPTNPDSIRQSVMRLLREGKSTPEITDYIQSRWPSSQAAAKPNIHISFYRSKLRSAGKLPAAKAK